MMRASASAIRFSAAAALIGASLVFGVLPASADDRDWRRHDHRGGSARFSFGFGTPYAYAPPYVYAPPGYYAPPAYYPPPTYYSPSYGYYYGPGYYPVPTPAFNDLNRR